MSRVSTATPLWVKLALAAAGAAFLAWWVVQRADRIGNEHRLAVIASQIAGRDVEVRCPGAIWRAIGYDSASGTVRFDENMKPSDKTKLAAETCDELDALAEGHRAKELECIGRAKVLCGRHGTAVAMAVDTLTHESFHLRGIANEADTECHSLHAMAWTAQQFGATAEQGTAMALAQYDGPYQEMGDAYRGPCERPDG